MIQGTEPFLVQIMNTTATSSPRPFVDFQHVWLAYNDELLAQGQFAVEDISLQMTQGEFMQCDMQGPGPLHGRAH